MQKSKAMALLNIVEGYDAAAVRAAYARAVKQAHPDTGTPGVPIQDLQMARDVLLASGPESHRACAMCHGRGKTRGRMGWRSCSACGGTGEIE